ncbi:hypothetical protein V1517DRAFT_339848 [Lipomyces orientalis]|uniref:Uncharacterized protein n=1 Tax=Lipomyces orientalis TaxID=1233043 RepID=A0ACC3TKE7_9ASCO
MSNRDYYRSSNSRPYQKPTSGYQAQPGPYGQQQQGDCSGRGTNFIGAVAGGFLENKTGKNSGHVTLGGIGGAVGGATVAKFLEKKFARK